LLAEAGHDVATVAEQGLSGAEDPRVIEVCGAERRCLVTLDLDFSNPFVFPPERYAGIAVLRPRRLTSVELLATVNTLIIALSNRARSRGSSGPSSGIASENICPKTILSMTEVERARPG
jgi:predicted nuclease of predicted toxin-antitoxin system